MFMTLCSLTIWLNMLYLYHYNDFDMQAPLLLQDNEPNEAASTPSSKRKNEENKDTPDKTSTSKKLCTKVIKKEKK